MTKAEVQRLTSKPPVRHGNVAKATASAIDLRIATWHAAGNTVAAGNLGEQVAVRMLERLAGHEILATQKDLQAAVPSILGMPSKMNPEDIIAVTTDNRLVTVNTKATMSAKTSKVLADGNLAAPSMAKGQAEGQYYSTRADLLSPLDGGRVHGQVLKVDLVNKLAQLFELGDDGTLTRISDVIDVLDDIAAICIKYPDGGIPAPTGPNVIPVAGSD